MSPDMCLELETGIKLASKNKETGELHYLTIGEAEMIEEHVAFKIPKGTFSIGIDLPDDVTVSLTGCKKVKIHGVTMFVAPSNMRIISESRRIAHKINLFKKIKFIPNK